MLNRIMMMMMMMLVGAIVAPIGGAVAHLDEPVTMKEEVIVTAMMPPMKVVNGRNNRRWWNGLDDDEKSEYQEKAIQHQRATRKNKHRKVGCSVAVLVLVAMSVMGIDLTNIALVGVAGLTAISAVPSHHRWTPLKDRNGNGWSEQQFATLDHIAKLFETNPIAAIRIMQISCAGSGKTTMIAGVVQILANAIAEDEKYALSLSMIAFNTDIAKELDVEVLKIVKKSLPAHIAEMWEARTLNSHGHRMIESALKELHPLGKSKFVLKGRYDEITRIAILNAISDYPGNELYAEWHDMCPENKWDKSKKNYYSGVSKIQTAFRNIVTQAMAEGMLIEDSGFTWDSFWADQYYPLVLSNEVPIGPQLIEVLPSLVADTIRTAMDLLIDPSKTLRVGGNAPLWLWDEFNAAGQSILDACNGNKKRAKQQMNDSHFEWRQGFYKAHRCTDAMLMSAGLLLEPETYSNGHGDMTVDNSGHGMRIKPYTTDEGRYATKYIQILFDYSPELNEVMKSISWGNAVGDKVNEMYSTISGSRAKTNNSRVVAKMPKGVSATDYVHCIKDNPKVIEAFISRVRSHMGLDVSGLFNGVVLLATPAETPEIDDVAGYRIPFDCTDQIYAPCYHDWPAWKEFDFLLVDEFQDMSVLKHMILDKLCSDDAGIMCVGDPKQAIYRFAGASSDSISLGEQRFNTTQFSMDACFRQTATLSREVRELMGLDLDGNETRFMAHNHPEWIESWPVGESSPTMDYTSAADEMKAGDMVLCPLSSQLVLMALECVKMGKPVALAGTGKIENQIRRMALKIIASDMEITPRNVERYCDDESSKLFDSIKAQYNGDEAQAHADEKMITMTNNISAINALVEQWFDSGSSLEFVKAKGQDWLGDLFGDEDDAIMFSTVHKSKGLEFNRVFLLCDRMTTDEDGNDKLVSNFMWSWATYDQAGIDEQLNIMYVALTRSKDINIFVTASGGETPRDAMASALNDYTTDHRDVADEGEDLEEPTITEMDIIEDEFEEDVFDEIVAMIDAPESTEPVDEVVEATPDESEATEMPLFACIWADSNDGEIKGAELTNDVNEAKAFLEGMMCETTGYKPGMWVTGHAYDCAIFKTDLEMPDDVVEAINASITPSVVDDETPDVDGADVIKATDIDAGDYIEIVDVDGVEVEIDHTPVVDDETPTRTRKTMDDRIEDLENAVNSFQSPNVHIGNIAEHMGCSVDTVKRVLEEMRDRADGVLHPKANVFNDEMGSVTPLMVDEWTEITWVPEHAIDAQDRIVIKCQRSPTGRFKRGSPITFTHIEYDHEEGRLPYKAYNNPVDGEVWIQVTDDVKSLSNVWSEDWAKIHAGQIYPVEAWYVNWQDVDLKPQIVWAVIGTEASKDEGKGAKFPPHYYTIVDVESPVIDDETPEDDDEDSSPEYVFKLVENAGLEDARVIEDYHPDTAESYNATTGNDGKLLSARNYLKICAANPFRTTKTLTIFWTDGEIVAHWSAKDIHMASLNPDGSDRCKEGFAAGYHHALNLVANLTNMDLSILRGADYDDDSDEDTGITEDSDDDDGGDAPSGADSVLESVFTGEELVSEDEDPVVDDESQVGFTDADGDFYCECWENFKGNVGCEKCEVDDEAPEAYLLLDWNKRVPYQIHNAGCNHSNLQNARNTDMEIVCEGTLEECIHWYFDVSFCENAESFWGNEEGFMVEDYDRYMEMTVQQFKNSQICKDTVHLGYAPCLSSDFKDRLKVLKIGDVSTQSWRETAVRIAAENAPVVDDETPMLTPAQIQFACKVSSKIGNDEIALGFNEDFNTLRLESNVAGIGFTNADKTVQFTTDGYDADQVLICGMNGLKEPIAVMFSDASESLGKIFKTDTAIWYSPETGNVVAEAGNCTKTMRPYDTVCMDGLKPTSMPNFIPNKVVEMQERDFKSLVTSAMKGGKNPGELKDCGVLWIGDTQVPEKAVKALADALSMGSKKNQKMISIQDNSIRYYREDGKGELSETQEHIHNPLVIRGEGWTYTICPMDDVVADKPTLDFGGEC